MSAGELSVGAADTVHPSAGEPDAGETGTVELAGVPGLGRLYARAVRSRGRDGAKPSPQPLVVADQPVDADLLHRYQRLCGLRTSDRLPATYLHLMLFPLAMARMTGPDFPFPLLGLVHLRNEIRQLRPVGADERVSLSLAAGDVREHRVGRQIELLGEVRVGPELVWSETSSYLHREKTDTARQKGEHRDRQPDGTAPTIRWSAPSDIGRRYAAVSGDRNPIHLHPLLARAFGFPTAIGHGMWLQARALAAFEGRVPDRCLLESDFKTPVLLPSTVELRAAGAGAAWRYEVAGVRSGKPHLAGTIGPLD